MEFNNLKELAKHVEAKIQNAMKNEVAKEVIETEKRHIQSDVYAVYSPTEYERTHQLIADESFVVREVEDGITVKNIRHDEDTGKLIAPVLESGMGYDWEFEFNGVPRPFTANTIEELKASQTHKEALKKGLKRQGIDVE